MISSEKKRGEIILEGLKKISDMFESIYKNALLKNMLETKGEEDELEWHDEKRKGEIFNLRGLMICFEKEDEQMKEKLIRLKYEVKKEGTKEKINELLEMIEKRNRMEDAFKKLLERIEKEYSGEEDKKELERYLRKASQKLEREVDAEYMNDFISYEIELFNKERDLLDRIGIGV